MNELPVQKRKAILLVLALLSLALTLGWLKRTISPSNAHLLDLDAQITRSLISSDDPIETPARNSISINSADVETLSLLPGIGRVKAGRIIEHRQAHGGFKSSDELLDVKGIGPKTFENLKDYISLE